MEAERGGELQVRTPKYGLLRKPDPVSNFAKVVIYETHVL